MNRGRASHGFDHIRRVSALCRCLGRELSADMEVLELAALLHDIGRDEQDRSGGKECHALRGADTAARLHNTEAEARRAKSYSPGGLHGNLLSPPR